MHAQPCGSCTIKIPPLRQCPFQLSPCNTDICACQTCLFMQDAYTCDSPVSPRCSAMSWPSNPGYCIISESLYSPPALQIWLNGTIKSQPSIYMITPDFNTPRFAAQWRS